MIVDIIAGQGCRPDIDFQAFVHRHLFCGRIGVNDMVQRGNKTIIGDTLEITETNRPLFFVEIPEVDLISFERGFRPGVPQTEMMVMIGRRTISHHFASQCVQGVNKTAAFINRIDARSRINRSIIVREQQLISHLIIQSFPRIDNRDGSFGRLARAKEKRKQKQIAIDNHILADQLLKGISVIFSEENKAIEINELWDYYPGLFEEEKKQHLIEQEENEFENFKARRMKFANAYNKKFKGDD